jgi:hypothetical protein
MRTPGEGSEGWGPSLFSSSIAILSIVIAAGSATYTYRLGSDRERHIIGENIYETFEDWNAAFLAESYGDPFRLELIE